VLVGRHTPVTVHESYIGKLNTLRNIMSLKWSAD